MATNKIGSTETCSLPELSSSQDVGVESVDACLTLAGQLMELLNEEASALRRFDSSSLLQLLPVKQYLIEELAERLEPWKMEKSAKNHVPNHGKYLLLESQLAEINRMNHSNGIFINGTLSFYQDIFRCLCPSNYTSEGRHSLSSKFEAPKGLTFRKEV